MEILTRADVFRIATYNVENYLDDTASRCCIKSAESKVKVRECIRMINPDVLALQEVGSIGTLMELRASLKTEGFDFPHWEHVTGSDGDLHVAILSKFPFLARRPYTGDSYELNGQKFRVRRGFAEVDVQINPGYQLTLLAAHLKSKNAAQDGDAAAMRLEEAKLLREKIHARLANNAEAKLIVLGDFNDTEDSAALKIIRGTGKGELFDMRPGESGSCASAKQKQHEPTTGAAWTNFHEDAGYYERIDYVLISQSLLADYVATESHVLVIQGWRIASDHRPVMATFRTATPRVIS
jgi:endonuclease/exonuclease/phosphatase family metal-dependent hydrolase